MESKTNNRSGKPIENNKETIIDRLWEDADHGTTRKTVENIWNSALEFAEQNANKTVLSTDSAYMKSMLYGDFTPNQRDIDLHERLKMYYQQALDEVRSQQAMSYLKGFKRWCEERGYTKEEIDRAKKNIRI